MPPQLSAKENNHVNRLHRFLPFDPTMEQIFEEYTDEKDSLNIETNALKYLVKVVQLPETRLIILTGDAGHGKTHLCRRLLEDSLGYEPKASRKLINTICDGSKAIRHFNEEVASRKLFIYKDFSEFAIELAVKEVEKSIARADSVTIICANEGRLRAILESESAGRGCEKLLKDFNDSFEDGKASRDGREHIINLNLQSVAISTGKSLVEEALKDWVDGKRWEGTCSACTAKSHCPIFNNRNLLSHSFSEKGAVRQQKLKQLFETAERLGIVITIREMLMTIAYLITGGLKCKDVHKKVSRSKYGWQHNYAFYNLLFKPPNHRIKEKLKRIPVVNQIARLDPGKIASRDVDERLINVQGQFGKNEIDIMYTIKIGSHSSLVDASNGIDEIIGNPRSRSERKAEAEQISEIVRSLRRRLFFDEDLAPSKMLRRLGFEIGSEFVDLISGNLAPVEMAKKKKRVIAGLHMLQGLRMSAQETSLHLVDPAFGNATSHAAIIAHTISASSIKLIPMRNQWIMTDKDNEFSMEKAVDWLDRHIVLRVELGDQENMDFPIDLMMFDCIMRASGGFIPEEFYAHDIRKVDNFLGLLAESGLQEGQDITLFLNGRIRSVSIDEGVIQVSGE